MIVFLSIKDLKTHLNQLKSKKKSIGFVPTMGALHYGHLSLIKKAKEENDLVVCSIFVNPIQFNDKKDLEKYPRTLKEDTGMLEKEGCDILFAPSVEEIYPQQNTEIFEFETLDKTMEGAQRPGHFNGVAIVVKRLFEIVEPHVAYFGQKDFQQLAIIKKLVKMLNMPVKIKVCPIIREDDGLAMSSRNTRLTLEERKKAPLISKTLFEIKKMTDLPLKKIQEYVEASIAKEPSMHLEYFKIVDSATLQEVNNIKKEDDPVACIAVKLGSVRLIDNIILFD